MIIIIIKIIIRRRRRRRRITSNNNNNDNNSARRRITAIALISSYKSSYKSMTIVIIWYLMSIARWINVLTNNKNDEILSRNIKFYLDVRVTYDNVKLFT